MNPKLPQFTIYLVTCLVNEKKYVGKTTQAIWARWRKHLQMAEWFKQGKRGAYTCSDITEELAKYGDNSFKLEVLEVCLSQAQMDERELWWMGELKTMWPHGYNRHLGKMVLITDQGRIGRSKSFGVLNPRRTQVRAVKDGNVIVFPSIAAFAQEIGVERNVIRKAMNKGLSSLKGYNFELIGGVA